MSESATNGKSKDKVAGAKATECTCGIIMPISTLDGCTADHWAEVKSVIVEAVDSISEPRFVARLVSDADEIGVIQKRIIQNVYNSAIVVCDVSGKNPNVMFELGLRLAFDKPTVIIKDDKTDYSFDTGVIEHVPYPRDLRFTRIVEFKKKLAEKVLNTYHAAQEDPKHSPFLKSFGQFHVASLTQTEASPDKIMLEMLSDIQRDLGILRGKNQDGISRPPALPLVADFIAVEIMAMCRTRGLSIESFGLNDDDTREILARVRQKMPGVGVNGALIKLVLVELQKSVSDIDAVR